MREIMENIDLTFCHIYVHTLCYILYKDNITTSFRLRWLIIECTIAIFVAVFRTVVLLYRAFHNVLHDYKQL
jgi:hypothetical protein